MFLSTRLSCAVTQLSGATCPRGKAGEKRERKGRGTPPHSSKGGALSSVPLARGKGFLLLLGCHHHHCRRNAAQRLSLALGRGWREKREKGKKLGVPLKLFSPRSPLFSPPRRRGAFRRAFAVEAGQGVSALQPPCHLLPAGQSLRASVYCPKS